MTSRSSIFSFSTLRASLLPGRALWLALTLVVSTEIALRFCTPHLGYHEGLSSLPQWVSRLEWELETRQPTVWLLGNSVLAYGIDTEALTEATGRTCLSLPFGNSSLAGDIAMLKHFSALSLPEELVVCITKDDVNPNGLRSWISRKYIEYDSFPAYLHPNRLFKLCASRQTIMNSIKSFVLGRETAAPKSPSEPSFNGNVTAEKYEYMRQYMQDYKIDSCMFDSLFDFTFNHHCRVYVVHVPVTTLYMDFHDTARPDFPFDAVVTHIAELCAERGFTFLDCSRMMPDDYSLYSDPDHLTAAGRSLFTQHLAEQLVLSSLLHKPNTDSKMVGGGQ